MHWPFIRMTRFHSRVFPQRPRSRTARKMFRPIGFLPLVLIATLSVALSVPEQPVGIVTASRLNLRPQPNRNRPPLGQLPKGAHVTILETEGAWLKVAYQEQVGYVRNLPNFIQVIATPTSSPDAPPEGDPKGASLDHLQHKADTLTRKIERSEARVLEFDQSERDTLEQLNDVDVRLNTGRRRQKTLEKDFKSIERAIAENATTLHELEQSLQANADYASQRLVALYKLHWLGHLPILASAETIFDFINRKASLERILSHDEALLKRLNEGKVELQVRRSALEKLKNERAALQSELRAQMRTMEVEKDQRTQILAQIRAQRSLELASIEALKNAAAELDRQIRVFNERPQKLEVTPPLEGKSFEALKGLLNLPVEGKITHFFGPYRNSKFNVVNFHSGIKIKADRGEPIHAVHSGRILFASWFKGYGNMIIIDHGEHYYTIYAHADELFKTKGEEVSTGDVIATVGDTGALSGPTLHFEVRHHGKPQDPLTWIKKG